MTDRFCFDKLIGRITPNESINERRESDEELFFFLSFFSLEKDEYIVEYLNPIE